MVGAFKIHLIPNLKSSKLVKQFFELTNNIPENVKNILFFVKTSISYLLFRVYSTEQLMINAASTMAAARMERSLPEQQFLIPHPKENSWGHLRVLDKENIMLNKSKCRPREIKREIAIFDLIYLQFRILEIMNEMIGFIYKTNLVE